MANTMKAAVMETVQCIKIKEVPIPEIGEGEVLIKVAAVGADDESVRSALITAARTIRSEHDRGRVLNAVFR